MKRKKEEMKKRRKKTQFNKETWEERNEKRTKG